MTPPLLSVKNLCKSYQSKGRLVPALRNITLSLDQGETLGITGPSGCGKSTLARTILRLIRADSGSIQFDGRNWLTLTDNQLRRERANMQVVFQNSAESFNRFATVASTIAAPLRIHHIVPRREREREILRLLSTVGLASDLINRPMHSLSGGQRQRVALARAISTNPKVIILDEAVSALDVLSKGQILALIAQLQQKYGLSCLFISHDFAAIKAICHRVAIMEAGEIIEVGQTQEIISSPQMARTRALIAAVPSLPLASDIEMEMP